MIEVMSQGSKLMPKVGMVLAVISDVKPDEGDRTITAVGETKYLFKDSRGEGVADICHLSDGRWIEKPKEHTLTKESFAKIWDDNLPEASKGPNCSESGYFFRTLIKKMNL